MLCLFRDRKRIRVAGFATLRKKFIRKRRSSKAMDHGRVIREVVSDWSSLEVRFPLAGKQLDNLLKNYKIPSPIYSLLFCLFSKMWVIIWFK